MATNADKYNPSDDVDLGELIQTLWKSRFGVIAITLVVTCLTAAYAFLSTPIYETASQTLPPTSKDLASYNVASQLTGSAIRGTVSQTAPGIAPITPQEAYNVFLRHLNSNSIRQDFFERYYLPQQEENQTEADKQRAWRQLNDQLTISLPKRGDEYAASVSFQGEDPRTIAEWSNVYVDLGIRAASEELLSGLAGEVKIREQSLGDQISTVRRVAETVRRDRITRLHEAITVAETLGGESNDGIPWLAISPGGLNTEDINSGSLLYLRGAKALRLELRELEQRDNNDAYIAELPDLLKKKALLKNINLDPDLLGVATIDRAAIVPEEPIKPNKRLIIIVGFIVGGMLGVLFALARLLIAPRRQ